MDDPAEVLSQLQSGELPKRMAKSYKAPMKAVNVARFLDSIGFPSAQVNRLLPFFIKPEFEGDPEDRIKINSISHNQLVRRLTNACLFMLWEDNQETDLADFLRKYRTQPYRRETTLTTRALRSFTEVRLEEALKCAEDSQAVITTALARGYQEALRSLAALLESDIQDTSVTDFATSQLVLSGRGKTSSLSSSLDAGRPAPNFRDFVNALSAWMNKPDASLSSTLPSGSAVPSIPTSKRQVASAIEETLKNYEALRLVQQTKGEDTTAVEMIIKACKLQLGRSSRPDGRSQLQGNERWLAKCKQGLSEIYHFYAKQERVGKAPSFAEIEQLSQSLSLSRFLKFLKDFGLSEAPIDRRSLSKLEGTELFMKFAAFRRSLTESGFLQALEAAAQAYFDEEYDRLNNTTTASLSAEEKLYKLYKGLECDEIAKYTRKLKGYGLPFSSDTGCRIPSDDPAKRYKFRVNQKVKEEISEWKAKRLSLRSNSQAPPPKKRRPKAEVVVEASQTKNVITWNMLGDISYEELKDPADLFEIRNLIVDSDSEEDRHLIKLPVLKPKVEVTPQLQGRGGEKLHVEKLPGERQSVENSYLMKAKLKHRS
jgi:hypothetical protein